MDDADGGQLGEQDDLTEADEADEIVDGEIVEADAGVTEATRDKDRNRAIQYIVAFFAGIAALHGVLPDALVTMALPKISDFVTMLVRIGRRRVDHAADTRMDAAEAADVPLDEFVEKALSDDRRHELFARTLNAAQDTARRDKRRALGRALAAGVMDDARTESVNLSGAPLAGFY